ncbi:cobalamin biosynthesis domain-containing protein [Gottschalkia acidurici 9a]|uniref:Cobalamin biosynthesis domain-containing protein n=1 Tax=Gottschalkia acidurici (strain ATCC 7906 / DSM 604 / BCRC 14475 / CIP 104303 / KCTC 5404 / NCIMB 10678 / 9a) TaxID=1128398 RepID=K0AZU0_GOTA9|nr:cobalamin biosynthesis domain-containing protein [Gottschalkia acidurici 9a]
MSSDKYKVYIGFLNSSNYIEESLVNIRNDGYKNVIVVPMFASKDESYNILENRIDKMKLFNLNMNIKYTEALGNSDKLVKSYMNKISKYIVKEKTSYTGVILIGSGEGEIEEDLMFRKK